MSGRACTLLGPGVDMPLHLCVVYIRLSLIICIQLASATSSLANERGINMELALLRNTDDTADTLRVALVSIQ